MISGSYRPPRVFPHLNGGESGLHWVGGEEHTRFTG
jgi:hypothetical protein